MQIYVQDNHRSSDYEGFDVEDLWNDSDGDEDSFFEVFVCKIAEFALDRNIPFGQVVGLTFDDDDGQELNISSEEDSVLWIREVAQLVAHIKGDQHGMPTEALLARIEDMGWNYFDFDTDLVTYGEDQYEGEFDGDYANYARERMGDLGESIPEHLESHFDYESYGEELIDDYDVVEWGYTKYLFAR